MQSEIQSLNIGLCRIDVACMDLALSEIRAMRSSGEKGYIITPNIDHLARLADDEDNNGLKQIYFSAKLSLCDSRILEVLLKAHGYTLPGVVPGSDLTARLFDGEINKEDRVYILGGDNSTIEIVKNKYPAVNITHHNPSMGFIKKDDEVENIIAEIVDYGPNYVFLAVGSPQQEIIASKLISEEKFKGIAFCIGASILFLVGAERRAPGWVQKLRLEWLYRILQNPSRLAKRYFENALKLPVINRHIAENARQQSVN